MVIKNRKTKQEGPGKWFRKGISLPEAIRLLPDEDSADRWFADIRWRDRPICQACQPQAQRRARAGQQAASGRGA